MATNHTENYQLNLWEPQDSFLREEFNENTEKIDAALENYRSVVGYYAGGAERTITLGFRPRLLLVVGASRFCAKMEGYSFAAGNGTYGTAGISDGKIEFTDDGFTVSGSDYYMNAAGYGYSYIAFH